jgi:hypothetical protein
MNSPTLEELLKKHYNTTLEDFATAWDKLAFPREVPAELWDALMSAGLLSNLFYYVKAKK